MISKALLLAMSFIVRTLFIRILGAEYTGINGLYSNILGILNLAELGLGSVFTYQLYKPLKDDNREEIVALVGLFKRIYTIVILVILGCGLALLPFLGYVVHSSLDSFHLKLYYILYLVDSVASYFVVYRTTVISADQKQYIVNITEIACKFAMYAFQSVYLVITRDFLGYLVIQVIFTVIKNVVLHVIASKMYPYLNNDNNGEFAIQDTKVSVIKNVKATFIAKISNVILSSTDNIIISMMFGTVYVGYYSNYYMFITYINSIYYLIATSVEASIGNLNAEEDVDKSYIVYKRISLLFSFINIICVAGYICVIQDFITVWIGEEYLQGQGLIISIMISFYIQASMSVVSVYRQTMGLFEAMKKVYPFMAMLNIVLSLVWGWMMGMAGVALATGISRLLTTFCYEGKIVFRNLNRSLAEYLKVQLYSAMITLVITITAYSICKLVVLPLIASIVIKTLIVVMLTSATWSFAYMRTDEWKWAVALLKDKFKNSIPRVFKNGN
jgi:O-antigen/teichoic acid export membrane protein